MRTLPITLVMLLGLAVGACSTTGTATGSEARGSRDLITEEELAQSPDLSLYDAVRRMRPQWLQVRGTGTESPRVYVDGASRGGLDELRSLRVPDVREVRYMGSRDATTRFGTGHTGGAILVTTRR